MSLVVVLLTITIFSILGLAIIGATLSNAKQVNKVEKDVQTVDLAEMGVQYYQARLGDFFHEQIALKRAEIKTLIEADYQNKKAITEQDIEKYEDQLSQKLIAAYNGSDLSPLNTNEIKKTVNSSTNSYFKIEKSNAIISCPTCSNGLLEPKEQIVLTYKSLGFTGNNPEKQITAKFVFTFSIDKGQITEKPIPIQNHDYTTLIPKPTGLPVCTSEIVDTNKSDKYATINCQYNSQVSIKKPTQILNSTIVFENGVTFDQVINKGIENSVLYITGNTDFNKQINGIHNSKILVKGNAEFQTINQGIHNSTIVVVGDVDFGEQQDKFKDLEHSSIYVIGDADFTDMDFSHFSTTAKICIDGNVTGASGLSSYPIYSSSINSVLFNEKCSLGVIENGDTTIEITDQFLNWDEKVSPIVTYN